MFDRINIVILLGDLIKMIGLKSFHKLWECSQIVSNETESGVGTVYEFIRAFAKHNIVNLFNSFHFLKSYFTQQLFMNRKIK